MSAEMERWRETERERQREREREREREVSTKNVIQDLCRPKWKFLRADPRDAINSEQL